MNQVRRLDFILGFQSETGNNKDIGIYQVFGLI